MNQRLCHDFAHGLAIEIVGVFENLLREEEKLDAYSTIYDICKVAIERHDAACEHQRRRLNPIPSEN